MSDALDLGVLGHRVRHYRKRQNMTLADLSAGVDKPVPYLSQLENGRIEPKIGLLNNLADTLDVTVSDLVDPTPPNRRAELELELARAQENPQYQALGLPYLKPNAKITDDVLEHVVALWNCVPSADNSRSLRAEDKARLANAELRREMRAANNYFDDIERVVEEALGSTDYQGSGPMSERHITELAAHFGFRVERAHGMPSTARSVTDQRNRIIYIPLREEVELRAARSVVLQTLGHYALDHSATRDFGDYLRQRVESNYFAAAALIPEQPAVELLTRSFEQNDLSIEDLKEAFYVSYEMAAHRFTNLATKHLDIPVHFLRCNPDGVVSKAYENDGIDYPADKDGTVEGMRVSRHWGVRQAWQASQSFMMHYQHTSTDGGDWWCATYIEDASTNPYAVSIGTTSELAKHFRGGDTIRRADASSSRTAPDPELVARWESVAWPSAAQRSHVLTALPPSSGEFSPFPGVDLVDVYRFLDRQRKTSN
ncbi:MAG: helix-turn-helix domain-containing protein [Acidimicrobiia bacterium]|nr:helix-turn-helix domain-containing protein [Acidimicrobiia bacterium]